MRNKPLEKLYDRLTPEQRFRLILAASGRGDVAERDRLVQAGNSIVLKMPDHAPWAHAFDHLALVTFIEFQEDAARYLAALAGARDVEIQIEGDDSDADGDKTEEDADKKAAADSAKDDAGQWPAWQQSLNLALAAGYMLRTRVDGWKLFCKQLHVQPFLVWEGLPGFERLMRAHAQTEKAAFVPEGMLRWLNAIRPAGDPEVTKLRLTVEAEAAAYEEVFRHRVQWWSG